MEFKKREIKKHKVPRPEMPPEMLEEQEEYSFENKMLIVSVICEPFELTDINEIESKCQVSSMGRNYNAENRQRNIPYDIREGGEKVKEITKYWNDWVNLGTGKGKKVRFAIRENKQVAQ
jgi:hypothetical protein|tara:strand:- start:1737 stop:2096 length:360 start_codon:yes stop_codon:yes gene_type:complete